MNERIKELRKQVKVDMHLHNVEDFRAMSGCFGLEGGNKIVDDYLDKFAELIVQDLIDSMIKRYGDDDELPIQEIKLFVKEHFGVEE